MLGGNNVHVIRLLEHAKRSFSEGAHHIDTFIIAEEKPHPVVRWFFLSFLQNLVQMAYEAFNCLLDSILLAGEIPFVLTRNFYAGT